ncbi:MAG: restriction endonuclease [Chromatiales bacterium]
MSPKPMWMVRAEVGGKYFEDFKEQSIVAIGWPNLGDMSELKTRSAFSKAVAHQWPNWKKMQVAMSAGTLYRFVREMKVGDRVLTYDPSSRAYLVGAITSEYFHDPGLIEEDPNARRVDWQGEVSRDLLSAATKNSLGAISTLFLLPEEAAEEIESRLQGTPPPARTGESDEEETVIDELLKDIQVRALEFIKDPVNRLDWEEMQNLVAGLLQAMGYKTRVSPSGPDRGKDIVASPDGFGFESPRIVVEVKHRAGNQMGSHAVRSFLGGRHKDDKGLYVSTGGFTKDARYEAERASIPLTLMDIDDLVKALLDHYDRLDLETQQLVPLKKIYWPV